MPLGLLAFFPKAEYPKPPPEFASVVGWLILACVALLAVWTWSRAESFRRGVLGREDPRTFAVLRILIALMTMQCFWNLEPYWRMLWSDEGVFLLEEARERLGRTELRGWTTEDGFLGWWGLWRFCWGKQSLLHLHGDPGFVRAYLGVFLGVLTLYAVGFRTRITGVVAWFMMLGIYNRNALYLEGTDTVYRVFWLLLILGPTGRAWSLDNALRVWRERREAERGRTGIDWLRFADRSASVGWAALWGLLFLHVVEMPTTPVFGIAGSLWLVLLVEAKIRATADAARVAAGEHAPPVVVYRLVPFWARVLMMAQLGAVYTTTGLVKTGSVWARGDSLYYALNMDHFYRFEGFTQQASALVSLNLFRIATWITHWWEVAFPVVLVGMILRFGHLHREEAWYRAQDAVRWKKWFGRAALLAAYGVLYRINVLAYPECIALVNKQPADPTFGLIRIHVVYAVVIPLMVAAWFAIGRWPLTLIKPGTKIRRIPLPALRIDQQFLRGWLLGRRLWLTLGFLFHGFLILFMNIGMFPFIMISTYAAFVDGAQWRRWGNRALDWLGGRPRLAKLDSARARALFGPAEARGPADESASWWWDPHRLVVGGALVIRVLLGRAKPEALGAHGARARTRAPRIPDVLVLLALLSGFGVVALRASGWEMDPELKEKWLMVGILWWAGGVFALGVLVALFSRRNSAVAAGAEDEARVMRGAVPRTVALLFCLWHVTSVAMTLFPNYPVFSKWRSIARRPFTGYVRATSTTQSWKMFAPNPPRSNTFMQTVVIEGDGDRWDLRNNALETRPNPWIINDRMRKMQRRMVGKGKWYLRYWANYQCREWTLRTGEMPVEIEVNKFVTKIPKPEVVWRQGPYDPRALKVYEHRVQVHKCARKGEMSVEVKERHGLPVSEADLEAQAKAEDRAAKRAEARRRSWARRKDFGGPLEAEEPKEPEPVKELAKEPESTEKALVPTPTAETERPSQP